MESLDVAGAADLMSKRLRPSSEFAQTFDNAGRAVIYRFSHPDRFFRIPETARTLISCFSGNYATEVSQVLVTFERHCGTNSRSRSKAVLSTIRKLINIGFLIEESAEPHGYSESMAAYYARSRAIPPPVCDEVARMGNLRGQTRVLDVGTGTGNLAIHLAQTSACVTGMDISKPFLEWARNQALSSGVSVNFVRGSGDKLVFSRKKYDLITLSQVFHWLDPVCAARGLYHCLEADGTLIILDQQAVLPTNHPLHTLTGYGYKSVSELQTTWVERAKFYSGLFRLTMPCERLIRLTGARCFRQRVCFDMDYARAFFLESNLQALMPNVCQPWKVLEDSLRQQSFSHLEGDMYWLVLRYREARHGNIIQSYKFDPAEIVEIGNGKPSTHRIGA